MLTVKKKGKTKKADFKWPLRKKYMANFGESVKKLGHVGNAGRNVGDTATVEIQLGGRFLKELNIGSTHLAI